MVRPSSFRHSRNLKRIAALSIIGAATIVGTPAFAATDDSDSAVLADPVLVAVSDAPLSEPQPASVPSNGDATEPQSRAISPVFSSRPGPLPDIIIAGSIEAKGVFSDQNSGSGSSFFSASFNPALYAQYGNLLVVESELEIEATEDGDTETMLEFGQLDVLLHNNATLVVGKFMSPVGQFQERLHPAWINRLPDAPPGFGHDGLQPGSDVGAQLRGGVGFGRSRLTYAVAVGNGPRLMDGEGALEMEGFGGDDNGNKAISGRLGFLPTPDVEFGASYLTAKVRGVQLEEGGGEDGGGEMAQAVVRAAQVDNEPMVVGPNTRLRIWGLDGAFTRGPWDVRAEFLRGTRNAYELPAIDGEESVVVPKMKLRAWYAQAAYRLSGVTQQPILQNLEPVVRYGEYEIRGSEDLAEENNEKRWDVGLNYWFAPQFVLHTAIEHRRFTARMTDRSDTRVLMQLGYGF